jgi:hypothetical protein
LTAAPFGAAAAIISLDSSFGANTITRDTGSGLEWLDLTVTQSIPWGTVESDLAPGGLYQGFRFALREEIEQLAVNAGATLPSVTPSPANSPAVSTLIGLLGRTFLTFNPSAGGDVAYSCGVMSGLSGEGSSQQGVFRHTACYVDSALGGQVIPSYDTQYSNEPPRSFTGSWLVRPVPVPAAVLLLGSALLGLAPWRRRRAAQAV